MIWKEPAPWPTISPLHPDPLLHALLATRVSDGPAARDFLDSRPRPAVDPFQLPGLGTVVERVRRALVVGETIAIFGDYDVDGISSTALLVHALRAATGDDVLARLPTRSAGYGLSPTALEEMRAAGASLVIAVDCGSTDHENVALARRLGLDMVILDHHQMADDGPEGALVASAYRSPTGPYRELAAAGVAYLLVVALAQQGVDFGPGAGVEPVELLDLAMLGTVADVSPLIGVNRPLVRDGLRQIATAARPGTRALCQRAGIGWATLTSEQVAFKLAPRLNAAGRMGDPRLALDLLLSHQLDDAARLAHVLERLNVQRRAESDRVVREAEQIIRSQPDVAGRRSVVVARPGWSSGVLGLAASRLVERFGCPVIVLSDEGELCRGSARSLPGLDITRALAECADLLRSHGGHSQAAGLVLPTANVNRLAACLDETLARANPDPPGPPMLQIDADLPPERVTLETADLISSLAPFGAGNEIPQLRVRGVAVDSYSAVGQDGTHLKLHLATPGGEVSAISWGAADRSKELVSGRWLDLVATLGVDHWNGRRRLQVEIKDFRVAT